MLFSCRTKQNPSSQAWKASAAQPHISRSCFRKWHRRSQYWRMSFFPKMVNKAESSGNVLLVFSCPSSGELYGVWRKILHFFLASNVFFLLAFHAPCSLFFSGTPTHLYKDGFCRKIWSFAELAEFSLLIDGLMDWLIMCHQVVLDSVRGPAAYKMASIWGAGAPKL